MSLTNQQHMAAAERLDQAEQTHKQIGLLTLDHPGMDMDDAYAIQAEWVKLKLARGRRKVGWKIGLTSKAMQYALNISTPDSGILLDDMVFPESSTIPADRFIQPRIEAEIAFVMKAPLKGPNVTIFDVLNATDFITPSLEILDTRIVRVDPVTRQARKIFDTISDNAANAGIVTGGRPTRPLDADMRWIGAIVSRNGEIEETGLGAGVLNHPAHGIAWLAKRLARYDEFLSAGDMVLSGSFIRPIEARHNDTIVADFGPCGSVSIYFA
ncbi:2-oxo-hepta-3-ene-1,7-dioic acid hydratase [Mesorhizobium sp. B2-4-9]|uniref:2-oxo-hept-4-ene-1,7-dioate hydratase n=1 Tax=Mesorhizobium sp. B2-4-9 TaxID=2589940 RepID=UPI001128E186|nr:2-oxo-hepta-3-ene-1,7-dioic acid hydratase [Mesorhizobium sp. B2-4-9]TPL21075.1 2-oxo-hepta-3-ene-1,7-dioic acid hydratase [Mesorhizobium sp. B2-4-9]